MLYYNVRNNVPDTDASEAYVHFNSCGWYENGGTDIHTMRPSGRTDYQLIYIKSGAMCFGDTICGAGTLYLYRPHVPQDYRVRAENTTYYWLHFTGQAFTKMLADATETALDIGYCEPFIALCREIVMQYGNAPEESRYYIQGRLLATVAALPLTKATQKPDAVDNAITYMNEYYTNRLSNEALAGLCGMSKFHFIRRFTQKTGKTPQKYHTDLLLSKSVTMLTDTNLKVAQIAAALGFDDSLYFSRLFKKAYGISPLEYRKRH